MSYYNDQSSSWPAPGRQASWEQPAPPSRSGTSSTVAREEANAFVSQFDEVDRATDNLAKSGLGKPFGMAPVYRRDSVSQGGPRQFPEFDQRMGGMQRHQSGSEYDGGRSHSASNVQGYYQNQRHASRQNDADQMAQAKRRMAAQRERELRNYHQEQQYHRNVSGSKSDRSMSPNTMNEEDRRELIARQHRALYGDSSSLYSNNNPTSSQDVRVSGAGRGPSPLAFDPFSMQSAGNMGDGAVQMPPRNDKESSGGAQEARVKSNSSPSNQNPPFSLFENTQQANRTSSSSPGDSPPRQASKINGSNVAPIGTRPTNNQGPNNGVSLSKRATTPLPSPLSYSSYNAGEQKNINNVTNTTSASMNSSSTATDNKGVGIWSKGPWGNAQTHGVQAPVWG